MELDFWIRAVEIPVIVGIVAVIWNLQRQLNDLKLEVAKNYIDRDALQHLERTLVDRLDTLERKLDQWISRYESAQQRSVPRTNRER